MLSEEKTNCTGYMGDMTRVILAACDCVTMDSARIKLVVQVSVSKILS